MLDVEAIQCILLACTDGPNQNLLLAEISFVLLIKCVFAIDPYEHIESAPPPQTVSHKHPQICFREQPLQELRTPHVDICGCTFTFYFYFLVSIFRWKKTKKSNNNNIIAVLGISVGVSPQGTHVGSVTSVCKEHPALKHHQFTLRAHDDNAIMSTIGEALMVLVS